MYFPYLRGKQFELVAIRELIEKKIISPKVIPIIEPIKLSSSLDITIKEAENNDFKLVLIFNPYVGEEIKNQSKILEKYQEKVKNHSLFFGYIINANLESDLHRLIDSRIITINDIVLIHLKTDFANEYISFFNIPPYCNLIPDQRTYTNKIKSNIVILSDHFNYKDRNSDYANDPDEFFSEDHIYYTEEEFKGFSDYSVIGARYSDKGFRPYAVVIHITYFDSDYSLRVKHFVSDTNDDLSDTPRKFYEALEKLIQWKRDTKINTYALDIFEDYYKNQTYPGLGALKKFSLMHHIELVGKYLEGKN